MLDGEYLEYGVDEFGGRSRSSVVRDKYPKRDRDSGQYEYLQIGMGLKSALVITRSLFFHEHYPLLLN
jgi:hypothetical protein